MKKLVFIIAGLLIVVTGCQKPIEKADEIFNNEGALFLGNNLLYFSSTIDFYYYGDLSNYWYSDDATYKEIIEDKYHTGYKGLTRLKNEIENINTKDEEISDAVNELKNQIEISQKELKRKQQLIESLDNYGGLTFNSSDILSLSNDSEIEKDSEAPENVKNSFDVLLKLLHSKYIKVAEGIFNLERRAFMISKPNDEERKLIRSNLKLFIQNKIDNEYKVNNKSKKEMVDLLFNIFEKEHPIDYSY